MPDQVRHDERTLDSQVMNELVDYCTQYDCLLKLTINQSRRNLMLGLAQASLRVASLPPEADL